MHVDRDTDMLGLMRMAERIKEGVDKVLLGVPRGKMAGERQADGSIVESTDTTLATVAAANEFGVPELDIPERSFLRAAITENKDYFSKVNGDSLKKCLRGEMDEETALKRLGVAGVGKVQAKIIEGPFVPNAPETIARKHSSRPLTDIGQLRQGVVFKIPGEGE